MNNLPQGFLSTLIAQKKLLGNGNSNNGSGASTDVDSFNYNIKDTPSFFTPDTSEREDYGMPIAYIVATLARKAKSVYERYLTSERGRELLLKANEYEIPYNAKDVDILTLRDKVEEFEEAIEKAAEYGIDWKKFGYDLIGIEQEVLDAQLADADYNSYTRNQYLANVGV